jgi:hypothetical protein
MNETETKIDPKEVRAQLGLAEDAPDSDVILALLGLVANLTGQLESMTGAAAQAETEIANRTLEQYRDRIPEGTEPFWREQLLANRETALGVIAKLPVPALPDPPPAPASQLPTPAAPGEAERSRGSRPPATPLRNRIAVAPDARPDNPGDTTPPADAARAVAIRNRAHEIKAREGVPFLVAFSRAEREIPEAR